jgi:hypothetical protein
LPVSLNENFKIQLFRFVDVLPYLTTAESLSRHGETDSNLDCGVTLLYVSIKPSRLYCIPRPRLLTSIIKLKNFINFINEFLGNLVR